MSDVESFTYVALSNVPDLKGEKLDQFRKINYFVDPAHYLSHVAHSSLFASLEPMILIIQEKSLLNFIMPEVSPRISNGMKQITIFMERRV